MPADQRIGPYRILRQIKRGGQGNVLLGYDPRLHRKVAIKIYPLPAERRGRREALREARLVAALDSPRIVGIYDVIAVERHLAMVMEYVPGCDLEQLLCEVRLSLPSVIAIARDIAAAIAVARQRELVHGDIKAANVLITADGRAKLTDFGIARVAFVAGIRAGSPLSLAPEQLRGDMLDVRTDLFGLGCLLYRMLTGEHAYPGTADLALEPGSPLPANLHAADPPTLGAELANGEPIPAALAELVSQLLQLNPDDRPANTHQVRTALRTVLRDSPVVLGRDLRAEAAPWFREESAEELPPEIPAAFQRASRSGPGTGPFGLSSRVPLRRWWPALLLPCLALVAFGAWRQLNPCWVQVADPRISVDAGIFLPPELSRSWLAEQLAQASTTATACRLAPQSDSVDGTALRSESTAAARTLALELRCGDQLCALALAAASDLGTAQEHAVLFPDAPIEAWQQVLHSLVGRVLAESGG